MFADKKQLQAEVERLANENQAMKEQIDTLVESKKTLSGKNTQLEAKCSDLYDESNKLKRDSKQLNDTNEILKKELADLSCVKTAMKDLKSYMSKPTDNLQQKANDLDGECKYLRTENTRLTQELENLGYLRGKVEAYERTLAMNTPIQQFAPVQPFRDNINYPLGMETKV